MRRFLTFDCEGQACAATIDQARGRVGLLIVSGGNETRFGAGRAMARLASELCREGISVFRFDRRGVGDSSGENTGFEGSGPDIAAALSAFRQACPHVHTLIAYGNCDAATALLLNGPFALDGLVLSNIWCRESQERPSPLATRAWFKTRLFNKDAWKALMLKGLNWKQLGQDLVRMVEKPSMAGLGGRVATALHRNLLPTRILVATGDMTGLSFLELWQRAASHGLRRSPSNLLKRHDSATHGFLTGEDYEALKALILKAASSSA